MLLDGLMPEYDATRIEHRVIDGPPDDVYSVAIHVDLLDAVRRSRTVRGLFALRTGAERLAAAARRSTPASPPQPAALRLADMPEHGDWVRSVDGRHRPGRHHAWSLVRRGRRRGAVGASFCHAFTGATTSWIVVAHPRKNLKRYPTAVPDGGSDQQSLLVD